MFTPIHQHMIIRANVRKKIRTKKQGISFLTDLVQAIGMTPVTIPQSVYVSESGNEGFTGSINLATSHIAYHMWDDKGTIPGTHLLMMDIYSCKEFSENTVLNHIAFLLDFKSVEYTMLDRDLGSTYAERR